MKQATGCQLLWYVVVVVVVVVSFVYRGDKMLATLNKIFKFLSFSLEMPKNCSRYHGGLLESRPNAKTNVPRNSEETGRSHSYTRNAER